MARRTTLLPCEHDRDAHRAWREGSTSPPAPTHRQSNHSRTAASDDPPPLDVPAAAGSMSRGLARSQNEVLAMACKQALFTSWQYSRSNLA